MQEMEIEMKKFGELDNAKERESAGHELTLRSSRTTGLIMFSAQGECQLIFNGVSRKIVGGWMLSTVEATRSKWKREQVIR
jgi:hypothetical protein